MKACSSLLLLCVLWLLPGIAPAQTGRNSNKSSNPYRSNYQRMGSGSASSYEIRGGTLWAWGNNTYGQLGDGTTTQRNNPVQIGADTKWSRVAGGFQHTVALKSDGTLWTWGFNNKGQLGDGTTTDKSSPAQIGTDADWVSVVAGSNHTVALKSNGTIWSWGYNNRGQLGDGTTTDKSSPVQIGTDADWTSITCGYTHTVALKSNGTLWAWGSNIQSQIGDGTTTNRNSPVQIGTDADWTSITCGDEHTLALKSDGTLWTWGYNNKGQLGDGTTTNKSSPVQIGTDPKWVSMAAGSNHTVALKSDGTIWAWGYNNRGQLGDGTTTDESSPDQIGTDTTWVRMSCGADHTLGLKSDGTLWVWGYNSEGQLGNGTTINKTSPLQISQSNRDWLQVTNGSIHTVGLKSDGTLWAWGNNGNAQLGDGSYADKKTPNQIGADHKWVSVVAGSNHTVALKSDGTIWAWGNGGGGQLGGGNNNSKSRPTQIGTDDKWVSIAAGVLHTVALKSDGTIWAWGINTLGRLGDGTGTQRSSPVQIGTDNHWVHIACGAAHTIGLKSDGTLWAWGYNSDGQLGNGTTTTKNTPTKIGNDSKWVSVVASYRHTIALKSDGTLWAWGFNGSGQLGDGTTTRRNSPVQIGTDATWMRVSCGSFHTIGLKSDGTLWAWGYNNYGQLGDGTTNNKNSPTLISGHNNVVDMPLNANDNSSSAIIKNRRNSICMTGYNGYGKLGDGTTTNKSSYDCANEICRVYSGLSTAASTSYTQPLAGTGNRTDFQSACEIGVSIMPSGASAVSGNVTAQVFKEASVPTYKGHAYVARHYDILPASNASAATATLILYFTQAEFNAYNAANGTDPNLPTGPTDNTGIANVRVSQFHGTPTGGYTPDDYPATWSGTGPVRLQLSPTSVVWNEEDSRWEVTVDVVGFSGFFVNGANSLPLPVVISSFTALVRGEKEVQLGWLAANPTADKAYVVERSADGQSFSDMGTLPPTSATSYKLYDYEPLMGKSHYRLRTVSLEGQVSYSAIRTVMLGEISGNTNLVRVYPSPAKDDVVLESTEGQTITGVITDMQGRILMQMAVPSGEKVSLAALAPGMYLLRTSDGQTVKIIKE